MFLAAVTALTLDLAPASAQGPGAPASASQERVSLLDRLAFNLEWRARHEPTSSVESGLARLGVTFAFFEPHTRSGWRLDATLGAGFSRGPYVDGGLEFGYEWNLFDTGALALLVGAGMSLEENTLNFPQLGCTVLSLGVCRPAQDVNDPSAFNATWGAEFGYQRGPRLRLGFHGWAPYSGVSRDGEEVEPNEIEVGLLAWTLGLVWRL